MKSDFSPSAGLSDDSLKERLRKNKRSTTPIVHTAVFFEKFSTEKEKNDFTISNLIPFLKYINMYLLKNVLNCQKAKWSTNSVDLSVKTSALSIS